MGTLAHASTGYGEDEQAWLREQAAALDAGRLAQIGREHLSQYLRDLAARDRRDLRDRLTLLLAHIIKCQIRPARISRG